MKKIIERGYSEVVEEHYLDLYYTEGKHKERLYHFFMCDGEGNVSDEILNSQTYKDCMEMKDKGELITHVRRAPRVVPHPTIIECCGERLICWGFTNTCDICGTDYNWNGSALAPRSQWGEETGESIEDILSVDNYSSDELLEGY